MDDPISLYQKTVMSVYLILIYLGMRKIEFYDFSLRDTVLESVTYRSLVVSSLNILSLHL